LERRSALGFDHLRLELVPLADGTDEGLEPRDDPVLQHVQHCAVGSRRDQHRADSASADDQRKRAPALVAVDPGELDRHRRQVEGGCDSLPDRPERFFDGPSAEQDPTHLRQEVGLAAAALGLLGPRAAGVGKGAHDHGRDEEHGQRDPVFLLRDAEPARGRDVEEVPRHGAGDGGGKRQPETPVARHEQDREQVEHARRNDRHDLLERIDQRRDERERSNGHDDAGGDGALSNGTHGLNGDR
jgi:hypothetical protein